MFEPVLSGSRLSQHTSRAWASVPEGAENGQKRTDRALPELRCGFARQPWWTFPGKKRDAFKELINELQQQWRLLAPNLPNIEDVEVIGINLTKRGGDRLVPARCGQYHTGIAMRLKSSIFGSNKRPEAL